MKQIQDRVKPDPVINFIRRGSCRQHASPVLQGRTNEVEVDPSRPAGTQRNVNQSVRFASADPERTPGYSRARARRNGRDGLAFPAPGRDVVIRARSCEANVTRPCGEGRTSPCVATKGARRRADARRDTREEVEPARETNREPSDAPPSSVSDGASGRSRWGHRSCYCEPVWRSAPGGIEPKHQAAARFR
jgi:hypothetical protein